MRFEVPQFIEVEDKIFGPFTWKQFLYLAGGAGALIMLYIFLPFWLFLILGTPVALFAAGLAFFPVNNRPLSIFVESMVKYASGDRLYLWKKQDGAPTASVHENAPVYTPPQANNIATLSRKLELNALEKGTPNDTDL